MKSYINNIKTSIGQNIHNIPGWRTDRKIIVIESDDWGSIRMPSKKIYQKLLNAGIRVDQCPFSKFDSLASETDLTSLFDVLYSYQDENGNHPIFTANTIVTNPDFEKIKNSNFKEYHYELFPTTLSKYPNHERSFDLMKEGLKSKLFFPQLHGREHIYVKRWMKLLGERDQDVLLSFQNYMADIVNLKAETSLGRKRYRAALNFEKRNEIKGQKEIIKDAQQIFETLFGFKSESFIAPNYTWSSEIEPHLKDIGVKFIQSSRGQIFPEGDLSKEKYKKHYIGKKNIHNQVFLVRNCIFEPSVSMNNVVDDCLAQIEASFRWKKPAIISSHRLNYIGYIDESNKVSGLKQLQNLLTRILIKWPMVEFMTSVDLGNEIIKGH